MDGEVSEVRMQAMQLRMAPKYIKGNIRRNAISSRNSRVAICVCLLLMGASVLWRSYSGGMVHAESRSEAASADGVAGQSSARLDGDCAAWDEKTAENKVEATWGGSVKVSEFGSRGCPGVILVHGASPAMSREWNEVAQQLARAGKRVLVPDFHSNPRTQPHAEPTKEIIEVLDNLAVQLRSESWRAHGGRGTPPSLRDVRSGRKEQADVVVMGKSWGGEHALRYASKRAGVVSKLVLVAPMGAGDAPSDWRGHGPAVIPALLLYADDDTSFAKVQVQSSHLMPQYTACTSRTVYVFTLTHTLTVLHASTHTLTDTRTSGTDSQRAAIVGTTAETSSAPHHHRRPHHQPSVCARHCVLCEIELCTWIFKVQSLSPVSGVKWSPARRPSPEHWKQAGILSGCYRWKEG